MCLLWFSLCHRHCQEGEVEDGWPGAGRTAGGCGAAGRTPVPLALLLGGRGRLCPAASSSLPSPSQEEELSWALLPGGGGSWRLPPHSAGLRSSELPAAPEM